ncbi:MAG: class I SAM-dependent methyltransferase, partial [Ignavibacteriales bacterium]
MAEPYIITETRKAYPYNPDIIEFAKDAGIRYALRQDRKLEVLAREEGAKWVIVWEPDGPVVYRDGSEFFYHPNMGKFRLAELRKGRPDLMIRATGLESGSSFLDCTLGLGADALVAAYAAGPSGYIVGVESSQLIAAIVKWGIKKYKKGPVWLKEAMDRINIVCDDHLSFLSSQEDHSFDIVYFDPMFRIPVYSSRPISPMRNLANANALSIEAIKEACRVAR